MARVRLLLSAPAAAEVAVGSGAAHAEAPTRMKDGVRFSTGELHPEGKKALRPRGGSGRGEGGGRKVWAPLRAELESSAREEEQ